MKGTLRSAWNKLLLKAMWKEPQPQGNQTPASEPTFSASDPELSALEAENHPPAQPPPYPVSSRELRLSDLISRNQSQSQPEHSPTCNPLVSPYLCRPLPYMSNGTIHVPPPTTWEGYQGHELDDVIQILPQEWSRVARCHFGEELGRYYHDPENDPEKPEVYATMGGGGPENSSSWTVCNVPLYQHRYSDNYPPPYDWVQASELLLPVKIDGSWSALYAAQRELNRLRDVDAYVSNRLRKLERDLPEAMDEKMKEAPWLDVRYVWAQRRGMLHAVGLGDYEQSQEHIDWEREGCPGPPPDGAKDTKWVWDVDKSIILRERLSDVGLLSPRYR